ncbi:MAG: lipopolysaccharide biosynthesis protein [Clostridia bacterium]|nr:lipopolysaccharide biosynthesis protein [Clostridia bacterium]
MIKIKHFKDLRLPARASISYTVAAALSKAAGLLFTPIFTRTMSAEDYGGFTLYITVLGLCTVVCTSLTSGGAMYKGYGVFRSERQVLTGSALGLSITAALPICLLVLLLGGVVGVAPWLVPFLFLQLVCDSAISARLAELRYLYSYREAAWLTVLTSLGTPLLSLFLIEVMDGTLARVIGLLSVSAVAAFPTLFGAVRHGLKNSKAWAHLMKYSLPMLPNALASSVIAQADKLILAAYLGKEALASYAVAHSIGIGLTFVTASLGAALQPWMMRKLAAGEKDQLCRTVLDISTGLGALTVAVVALAPEALGILTPSAYASALPAILPIALSVLPNFTLSVLAIICVHREKPSLSSVSTLSGALVNILANLILTPRLLYFGAGVSLLSAYVFANVLCFALISKRVSLGGRYPFRIALIFGFTTVFSLAATALYSSLPARLALLILPALALARAARSASGYVSEVRG